MPIMSKLAESDASTGSKTEASPMLPLMIMSPYAGLSSVALPEAVGFGDSEPGPGGVWPHEDARRRAEIAIKILILFDFMISFRAGRA